MAFKKTPLDSHKDATQPTFYRSESDKSLIMSDLQIDTDLFGTILIQVWYNTDTDSYFFHAKSDQIYGVIQVCIMPWFVPEIIQICIGIVSDLYQDSAKMVCINL